ncbi:hypothetical protein DW015_11795 [Ruminococcus sp. AF37-20]|nr:hypothetical protein [Ruminococcus sp. AF37-20]RGF44945.1 hypothetical protein DW015_11795 [Ruminococcus sp. AF37-20]
MYLSKFDDQSSEEISVNVTGKMIVQKNISKIPLKLPYICGTIKEQVKNIYDSKIVDTDLLKIGINNGYQQVISGPMAYISTITVGYVPNKEFYSIFGNGTPSSIYNLKNDYWAQYADTISPALYIDNKIIYEWNGALTSIGKTQYLNIASVSSNGTLDDTKEILVGSVNSISTDNQNISAQSLLTAYGKMPLTDEEQAKVCGYEVSKKISPELLDSIFKSGQASDIVAILSKYDDEAIVAINKILDKDAVAALIRDYGDDGFKVAVKGGDYLVKAINNLDDDAAELFVKTASKQSDEFFVLMSKYDDIPSWACSDVIDFNSAENVNEILKQNGYTNPPYKPGTNVTTIELTENTTFVRVYDGEISGKYGGWIMNYNEIKELSPIEIKNRFALQNVPKYICDVKLPKGSRIRFGIANGISEWGNGGGVQFDLMRQEIGEFYNERLLS